jgi:small subunit ribosomal protein S6
MNQLNLFYEALFLLTYYGTGRQWKIHVNKRRLTETRMRSYELIAILKESQAVIEETKTAIKDIMSKYSAEVSSEEDMGSKKLHHRIGQAEHGYFFYLKFNVAPDVVAKIEHEFKINQNILRALIVRL